MTLPTLIRKGALTDFATATPATFATEQGTAGASVARVATAAVANLPSKETASVRQWRICYPNVRGMDVLFTPAATRAQVADLYLGAAIEPIPDTAARMATEAEAAELRALIGAILADELGADRSEALAVALADPVEALLAFGTLAPFALKGAE